MEWQPIDTAPKDSRLVLIRQPYGDDWSGTYVAYWSKVRKAWMYSDCSVVAGASHWMPLPEAPKNAS